MRELKKFFPPEFLNRIDEIVYFDPLGPGEMARIARLQLSDLALTLAREGKRLVVHDAAAAILAKEGYHAEFGARHLSRALRRLVVEPLAGISLTEEFRRATVVHVDEQGGAVRLSLAFDEGLAAEDPAVIEEPGREPRERLAEI
jgi:ATP-dependent Clp protease ATP-binding subunit ClpA